MNLEIGAEVLGPDGKLGTLTQIVIEPLGERVTHVIVERGGLHPWEKVVPTDTLTHTENARVWTTLSLSEMEALPDFLSLSHSETAPAMPTEVPLADLQPVGLLWPSNVLGWYLPSHQSRTPAPPQANLPPGSHGLKSGTEVHCRDGMVGHLDEVVYDQASGRATGMIIRKGFFFARELEAPIDWVEAINDTIRLRVSCDEVPPRRRRRR